MIWKKFIFIGLASQHLHFKGLAQILFIKAFLTQFISGFDSNLTNSFTFEENFLPHISHIHLIFEGFEIQLHLKHFNKFLISL